MLKFISLFLYSTFMTFALPSLIPFPITTYAPFLAFILLKSSLRNVLGFSLLCGLMLDCLQTSLPFGLISCIYLGSALVLYKNKTRFFHDKLLSLPLFAIAFSLFTSLIQLFFLTCMKNPLHFSRISIIRDFIIMPACDGLYAFIGLTLPSLLYRYIKQHGFRFIFIKSLD